jgi:hypothetical protein
VKNSAVQSFTQAAILDPTCAMAYWGLSFSSGDRCSRWTPRTAPWSWRCSMERIKNAGLPPRGCWN